MRTSPIIDEQLEREYRIAVQEAELACAGQRTRPPIVIRDTEYWTHRQGDCPPLLDHEALEKEGL